MGGAIFIISTKLKVKVAQLEMFGDWIIQVKILEFKCGFDFKIYSAIMI